MALERFKRKLTIENLWIYVLSLLQEKPRYGYEIWSSLKERFGFRPGKVTSYLVLYRLVQEGYIILQGEKKGGLGPARKYYAITNRGEELLKKAESFLNDLQAKVFNHKK
ncbi:PadR family transcriptional regulator [[Eubacterium] cellulosolvens]